LHRTLSPAAKISASGSLYNDIYNVVESPAMPHDALEMALAADARDAHA
jgi:hypothetical protein